MWLFVFQFQHKNTIESRYNFYYFLPGATYFLVAFPIASQTNKSSHSAKEDLLINGLCLEGRDNFRLNMAVLLMGGFEVKATPQNLSSVKTDMELQTVRTIILLKTTILGVRCEVLRCFLALCYGSHPSTCNAAPHPCLIAHLPTCLTV